MNGSDRTLDRFGAIAGFATVLLFVAIIMVSKALPPPNHTLADITRTASDDSSAILRSSYLGALVNGTLIMFGAAFAARLRRAEGTSGGWWIVALAGVAGTSVGLVVDMLMTTFVRAVGHGVRGDALWVGYPSGPDGVLIAIPLAVFFLGAGMGARATHSLPRWLTWLAIALAPAFTIGAAGVAGDEVDGGILGTFLLLGYVGFLAWTAGSSVSMLRHPGVARN